jgi:hypothetical protein
MISNALGCIPDVLGGDNVEFKTRMGDQAAKCATAGP